LKGILKDLAAGQRKMKQLEAEEMSLLQNEQNMNSQLDEFGVRKLF
jgi:hypothetical protein